MCLRLGYAHPDHLLRDLTARQIAEWLAYYKVDPWDEQRGDLRNGLLIAALVNAQGGKCKPSDFMLFTGASSDPPPAPKKVDKLATMRAWFAPHLIRKADK